MHIDKRRREAAGQRQACFECDSKERVTMSFIHLIPHSMLAYHTEYARDIEVDGCSFIIDDFLLQENASSCGYGVQISGGITGTNGDARHPEGVRCVLAISG